MVCQGCTAWDAAPACSAVICFASFRRFANLSCDGRPDGSLPTFVEGDVARWRNPYPPHYRTAFAFSIFLYPPPHRLPLRDAFPSLGEIRAYHVPSCCPSGLGASLFAGSFSVHDRKGVTSCASYIPF